MNIEIDIDARCKHCRQGKENRQRFKDWENKGYPVKIANANFVITTRFAFSKTFLVQNVERI